MKEVIKNWIESIAIGMEVVGVLIIAVGLLIALLRYMPQVKNPDSYKSFRQELGKVILLGLEVLVGADIIATVTADVSMDKILILGIIVLIRTFLSLSIELEIEGKLPWRK